MSVYNNAAVDNLFSGDADFRLWVQAVEAAILASGFLEHKSAETGQIDPTTVTRPAGGTMAGFRMYRATDSLQATKPIFVKVNYGCGSTNSKPKLSVEVGTGTNGAGTFTTSSTGETTINSSTADGSGIQRIMGCGDEGSVFVMGYDPGISSQCWNFYIARSIDRASGDPTGDFVVFGVTTSQSSTNWGSAFYHAFTGSSWPSFTFSDHFPRPDNLPNNGGDVNTAYLFDSVFYRNAQILSMPFVIGKSSELPYTDPVASSFTISVWSGTRTFMPIPWATLSNSGTGTPCVAFEV